MAFSSSVLKAQSRVLLHNKLPLSRWRGNGCVRLAGSLFESQFSSYFSTDSVNSGPEQKEDMVRLSKIISQHSNNFSISRREAERIIREGGVTVAGEKITTPHFLLSLDDVKRSIKVGGKLITVEKKKNDLKNTRVWLVHKLAGEVTTDVDPEERPSLFQRLRRGGVGSKNDHLKAVGRLDISTEGLILVTNNGAYKRQLELPSNRIHRRYRARVHGKLTPSKLSAIRNGVTIGKTRYGGMKVQFESNRKGPSTNNWLQITCTEGKNRQIRKVCEYLRLNVTRLIRIGYGDYSLNTIPPGMAIEVPVKLLSSQKRAGNLRPSFKKKKKKESENMDAEKSASPIQWVKMV